MCLHRPLFRELVLKILKLSVHIWVTHHLSHHHTSHKWIVILHSHLVCCSLVCHHLHLYLLVCLKGRLRSGLHGSWEACPKVHLLIWCWEASTKISHWILRKIASLELWILRRIAVLMNHLWILCRVATSEIRLCTWCG